MRIVQPPLGAQYEFAGLAHRAFAAACLRHVVRVRAHEGLRVGEFDVLIGISLLREGLDIPEASLIAIFDADRAGFLRSAQGVVLITRDRGVEWVRRQEDG